MLSLMRIIAGAALSVGGLIVAGIALFKHGAWVALCALLIIEGLASLILPNMGEE